jgi:hypothetical protein
MKRFELMESDHHLRRGSFNHEFHSLGKFVWRRSREPVWWRLDATGVNQFALSKSLQEASFGNLAKASSSPFRMDH